MVFQPGLGSEKTKSTTYLLGASTRFNLGPRLPTKRPLNLEPNKRRVEELLEVSRTVVNRLLNESLMSLRNIQTTNNNDDDDELLLQQAIYESLRETENNDVSQRVCF